MDTKKLKGKIVERGYNNRTLAKELGISRTTLWRKLSGGDFKVGEAEEIIALLQLSHDEVAEIFFPNYRKNTTEENV